MLLRQLGCHVLRHQVVRVLGPEHLAVLNPAADSHLLHLKPLRPQVANLAYARSLSDAESG